MAIRMARPKEVEGATSAFYSRYLPAAFTQFSTNLPVWTMGGLPLQYPSKLLTGVCMAPPLVAPSATVSFTNTAPRRACSQQSSASTRTDRKAIKSKLRSSRDQMAIYMEPRSSEEPVTAGPSLSYPLRGHCFSLTASLAEPEDRFFMVRSFRHPMGISTGQLFMAAT